MRGVRWPENILRWMIDIRHIGGDGALHLARGPGMYESKDSGALQYDHTRFNLYLPSISTIKSYLRPLNISFGWDATAIKELGASRKSNKVVYSANVVVSFDEVKIKKDLIVRGEQVIGSIQGPVPLDDVHTIKTGEVASFVLLFMCTTLDGNLQRPVGMFSTTTADAVFLQARLCELENLLLDQDLILCCLSSDCASANMSTFAIYQSLSRFISHPDYSHLVKNIRNHVLVFGKMHTAAGHDIDLTPITDNRDSFPFLPALTLYPTDKQCVRIISIIIVYL